MNFRESEKECVCMRMLEGGCLFDTESQIFGINIASFVHNVTIKILNMLFLS